MPQKQAMRAEPSRPLTFSEEDLKTRHPWLISSLYTSIPYQCKTCGRRIHSQAEMTIHLDWHFAMHKRAATIAKTGGVRSQNWYWEQEEWVHATDVIFGVQKRNAPGITTAAGATSTNATTAGADQNEQTKKHAPQSVPADENQKKCMVCNEEFKTEWSNDDESWMYRDCMRVSPSFLTDVQAQIVQLEAAKPNAAMAAAADPAQAEAHAAKEEDRLTQLYRCNKIVTHVKQFQGLILHQACHYGLIGQIMKSKRPADVKAETGTKVEGDPLQQQQLEQLASSGESKSAELPALE